MIVVYYIDCAPIFFLFFCLFIVSNIIRVFLASSPSRLYPIARRASNRRSRPITYGAFAPFVYPCYTFGIGLVSFAIDECKGTLNIYPFPNFFCIFFKKKYPRL